MEKSHIDTESHDTIHDCLSQFLIAEETQLSIESQLANSNCSNGWGAWQKKAKNALRMTKGKRRIITARLVVLRHEEKERNMQLHQQQNDFLVQALREIVSPYSFERCVRLVHKKTEGQHAKQC